MGFGKGLDYDCHIFFYGRGQIDRNLNNSCRHRGVSQLGAQCEITSPLDFDSRVTIDLRLNRGINLPTDLEILPICHQMGRQ